MKLKNIYILDQLNLSVKLVQVFEISLAVASLSLADWWWLRSDTMGHGPIFFCVGWTLELGLLFYFFEPQLYFLGLEPIPLLGNLQ